MIIYNFFLLNKQKVVAYRIVSGIIDNNDVAIIKTAGLESMYAHHVYCMVISIYKIKTFAFNSASLRKHTNRATNTTIAAANLAFSCIRADDDPPSDHVIFITPLALKGKFETRSPLSCKLCFLQLYFYMSLL